MNRLFNKLLIPTIVGSTILPITSCSNTTQQTSTIEILTGIHDINLVQNQDYLSQPIIAKCFDSDKQEQYIDIDFKLEVKGFDTTPDWICLTTKQEIQITNIPDVGEYQCSLVAFNLEQQLYSQPKTFTIKVVNERHIVPDSISLEIENNRYCMYGEETTIPIDIVPFKTDTEEKYLLKDTRTDVYVIHGPKTDGNLFEIGGSSLKPTLIVSKSTDKNYVGSYRLLITSTLLSDPNIYDSKIINLNIDNIYEQHTSKYTFTRESSDDTWTISCLDRDITMLYDIPSVIQNKPVTKVASNLCSKSNIRDLVEIILPPSITTIGARAFANQTALSCVEMPGVKYVGESAFDNDQLFEFKIGVDLPTFYYVGTKAFYKCKMTRINAQNDLMLIGDFAFKNAGFSDFEIGRNCIYIGTESFANCSNLKSFKIWTTNPPQIGGADFNKCDQLSAIKVPYENVGDYMADPSWSRLGKSIEGI